MSTESTNSSGTPERRRDRRWRVVVIALVPVLILAALLGFGLGRDTSGNNVNQLVGTQAPEFELKNLRTGEMVRLSDLRGHPVVMNFWASWCVDCIVEHTNLATSWQRFGNEGVVFLSVLYQDTPSNADDFLQDLVGDWPDLYDEGGRTALDYGVTGVPETVFISPDGVITHKVISVVSTDVIREQLQSMSKKEAA
jgi:cytochrome c biogenesis protein CcmG/thiol:disulfide interchange protein DsbE